MEEKKQEQTTDSSSQQDSVRQPDAKYGTNPELSLIGQEISGCVILEKISSGGMGTVFRAKHKALNRIVCVKILSPLLANDKKAVGLFLTEARAIAEIDHPNIVFVYNVGREKGFYFIVMSFIEGESLSSIVRKKPNLPITFVVDTFIGILRGLEAAHQKGIIHRDIKPSNILINKKLEPKIVDFGIAKKIDKEKGFAKTTELAGTAYFLSPEQALGRAIDTRADLYSIGASMFYVLTARYPYTGKNSMEIIQKHINEPVPNVSDYRRGVPPWLSAAIAKLMSKDPKDRFQTATETLMYFQKMRAEEQLKISQERVNIADELGLKISNTDTSAQAKDEPRKISEGSGRFNVTVAHRKQKDSSRISLPMLKIGDAKSAASLSKQKDNFPASRFPFPNFNTGKESRLSKRIFSSFFMKSVVFMLFALLIMLLAFGIFFKLGSICSAFDIAEKTFVQSVLIPWVSPSFLPEQLLYLAIAFVFMIFSASMLFFNHIRRIVPFVFLTAVWAYFAGLFNLLSPQATNWLAETLLPLYAFLLGGIAIKIDESNYLGFLWRFCAVGLFCSAFYFVYLFAQPDNFEIGALTTPLFYTTIALVAATCIMPFLRGGFLYRMATVLLFVASCAVIWMYQTSGNVYYTLKQVKIQEQLPDERQEKKELSSKNYMLKNFTYAQYAENEEIFPQIEVEEEVSPKETKEENPAEPSPEELRSLFISNLNSRAHTMSRAQIEYLVWVFALNEPFEKFKYNYRSDGFIMALGIALMVYGLLIFIISMVESGKNKWTLI
ncbi:MAG: serine/threonine protein kinase [Elusimicrobiota bacterium]|jgi:serine/threonine protein kinase|nr:serine/threonine protein kinase [Elusimicrobiota bacterium]